MVWEVHLPLKVALSKNKHFMLNLNQYRNAHHMTLNNAKIKFAESVSPLICHIPKLNKCSFLYTYYAPSKREVDISNVCSVVDKFFSDVFVSEGKLEDDNFNYLDEVSYVFGGIDKENPRVTVTITSKEEEPMKIVITATDLQQAIQAHISQFGIEVDPSQISIDLDEIEIELNPVGQDAPVKQTEPKKRTRRSSAEVAAEKAAKEQAEPVDTLDPTQDLVDEPVEHEDVIEANSVSDVLDEIEEPTSIAAPVAGGSIFD